MRITCPGCGAVFDVPDRAVPHPGRDVQCATCGTSWFLLRSGHGAGQQPPRAAQQGTVHQAVRDPGTGDGTETDAGTMPDARAVPGTLSDTLSGPPRPPEPVEDAMPPAPHPPRRVAPDVLAILRAEAETERRARQRADVPAGLHTEAAVGPRIEAEATPDRRSARPPGLSGASARQAEDEAEDAPADAAPSPGREPPAPLGARDRLARLTAAERRPARASGTFGPNGDTSRGIDIRDTFGTESGPIPMGTRTGAEDHGLVEDPGAAARDPRPPVLRDLPDLSPDRVDTSGMVPSRGALPATVALADRRALVILRSRRRGFRLGFGATIGLCCGALALYLMALNGNARLEGAGFAEAVRTHGGHVHTVLADWLRRVVAPALS